MQQQAALPAWLGTSFSALGEFALDSSGYSKNLAAGNLSIARSDGGNAAEQTRRVVMARSGRVRVCKPAADATCTEQVAD